jgi:hypothetical protein
VSERETEEAYLAEEYRKKCLVDFEIFKVRIAIIKQQLANRRQGYE